MTREFKADAITKQELKDLGLYNVDTFYGAETDFKVATMADMLGMPEFMMDPPIYVVTTKNMYLGAAILAYPNFFEKLATELNSNLIILPSSIHEILIIKESDAPTDRNGLAETIGDVNSSMVDVAERLGDEPLYYKRGSYEITNKKHNPIDRDEAVDIMTQVFTNLS